MAFIDALIEGGDEVAPGIGSDIALEGAVESAYPELPLRAARSLFAAAGEVAAQLGSVTAPDPALLQRAGPRGRPGVR